MNLKLRKKYGQKKNMENTSLWMLIQVTEAFEIAKEACTQSEKTKTTDNTPITDSILRLVREKEIRKERDSPKGKKKSRKL